MTCYRITDATWFSSQFVAGFGSVMLRGIRDHMRYVTLDFKGVPENERKHKMMHWERYWRGVDESF